MMMLLINSIAVVRRCRWLQRAWSIDRLLRGVLRQALRRRVATHAASATAHALRLRLPAAVRRRVTAPGVAHHAAADHTGSVVRPGCGHVVSVDDGDVTYGEQRAVTGRRHVGPVARRVTWPHDATVRARFDVASTRSIDDVILAARSHRVLIYRGAGTENWGVEVALVFSPCGHYGNLKCLPAATRWGTAGAVVLGGFQGLQKSSWNLGDMRANRQTDIQTILDAPSWGEVKVREQCDLLSSRIRQTGIVESLLT